MKIEKFVIGSLGTNCYLLINEETKEMVVVDPAICPDDLLSHVKESGYIPKAILLTHGHFDHVMGIDRWVKEFQIPVYLHEDERELLANPDYNMSGAYATEYSCVIGSTCEGRGLKDGETIELAGMLFKVIHTPGHTAGGCCYYTEDVLISGDTLFYRSVGRSDLPTGDGKTLEKSIREKLFCLPEDVMVYPGHGRATCIADEKEQNPFL